MLYETAIPFRTAVRSVCLADPEAPLPAARVAPPPPPPAPAPPAVSAPPPPAADHAEVLALLASLRDLGRTLAEQQVNRVRELQQAAVELAVAVASHLTYQQLDAGDFRVAALVEQVIQQLGPRDAVRVYLNPLDLTLLKRQGEGPLPLGPEVRLLTDPQLKRGDCRAETDDVMLLSQLEENIQTLRQDLLRTLPQADGKRGS